MRELIYGVEGKVANLKTFAMDEPGHGGACHEYRIESNPHGSDAYTEILGEIRFQNGPINAGNDINGVQHEDLLAIIIDRLEGFQKGPYACHANQQALDFCRCALSALNDRTRERIARKVEGTHTI